MTVGGEHALEEALLAKVRSAGAPLAEVIGQRMGVGLKTAPREAFWVDSEARERLLKEDPASAHLFHRVLRREDVERWAPEWGGSWLILLKSSVDFAWPWRGQRGEAAEGAFHAAFPAIYRHMKASEGALRRRREKGQYWWELGAYPHYEAFERPKIVAPQEQVYSGYALDGGGVVVNTDVFFACTGDPWVLAVLNSPLLWWYMWRSSPRTKGDALVSVADRMEALPIARPSALVQEAAAELVPQLAALMRQERLARAGVFDALRAHFDVESPGEALFDIASLDEEGFVLEVLSRRPRRVGKLKPPALRDLRELYYEGAPGMKGRRRESLVLERRLSGLVNEAYGLVPAEVELLWTTAPPRMPAGR